MAITSIGNDSGALIAADLLQRLGNELGNEIERSSPSRVTSTPTVAPSTPDGSQAPAAPGDLATPGAIAVTVTGADASVQAIPLPGNLPPSAPLPVRPNPVSPGVPNHGGAATKVASVNPTFNPVTSFRAPAAIAADVANVLLSEVATTDIAKLTRILEPAADPVSNRLLDNLLVRAVQEVVKGNAERAIGYLADYATRDPRRAEALPLQPELEPVRDKIDSMVSRMTIVAKMSAEAGLSRAEHKVSETTGKLSNWDTHAEVLIKVAQRFFEAGGYANYSRTSELAKVVTESVAESKPAGHALAASAAASAASSVQTGQMVPGVNVPYWASPDITPLSAPKQTGFSAKRRFLTTPLDDVVQNLRDVKDISSQALNQLWRRAPLLVLLLVWFALGFAGGIVFSIASHVAPDSTLVVVGNFAFNLWAIGCIGLVGLGFYMRVRK